MPDFVPNSTVILLSNVPLDNTYQNTLTFASSIAQQGYFQSKAISGMTFSGLTYQRTDRALRAEVNVEQLWNCNYLMFQNTNFGSKWFYAFVTNVEFRGQNVTYVYFEIDVMQTWAFDYSLKPCFVEREHVNDDTIGLHTVPENLETGPYITTTESNFLVEGLDIYIYLSEDGAVDPIKIEGDIGEYTVGVSIGEELPPIPNLNPPEIIGGFPVPCYWARLGTLGDFSVARVRAILDTLARRGKSNAAIAIFTVPSNMVSTGASPANYDFTGAARTLSFTPKNNKLYTYPYCCLDVICQGQSDTLRYELFNGAPLFKCRSGFGPNMKVVAWPQGYEGKDNAVAHSVSLGGWPTLAGIQNNYQNWLAQNSAALKVGMITDLANYALGVIPQTTSTVGNAMTGNVKGLANDFANAGTSTVNYLSGVMQNLLNYKRQSAVPDSLIGNADAADIESIIGTAGFYTSCRTVTPEYGKIIDDFFSMFGYKVNAVKVPNISGRESWNYVKTVSANIVGSIPFNTISQIKTIFDKGITFWHGDYVGDYTRSNNIVTSN